MNLSVSQKQNGKTSPCRCCRLSILKVLVPGLLQLGEDDRLYLDFLDVQPSKVVRRRIGFNGEQKIEESR